MYAKDSTVNLANGTEILGNCLSIGAYATKYSTIYNLRNGDIELHQFHNDVEPVKMNLFAELQKGAHIYSIPNIDVEIIEDPKPLPINFTRLILFENAPLDHNETSRRFSKMIKDLSLGTVTEDDYETGFWRDVEKESREAKQELQPFRALNSVELFRNRL